MDGDLRDVPDPHRTYLYRIVQEGLTNCARHAQAKNIHVKLEDSSGKLAVLVEDDGVGFDQHSGVAYGLGFTRHRPSACASCAASCPYNRNLAKGTRIAVVLPLKREMGPADPQPARVPASWPNWRASAASTATALSEAGLPEAP